MDILQELPYEDLPKLRDFYEKHQPLTSHIYSLLNTAMKWIQKCPDKKYFTFLAPDGDWKSDGTFIVIQEWSSYDITVFTLEVNCTRLYEALRHTKQINWNNSIAFYYVHRLHYDTVMKVIEELNLPIDCEFKADIWWMPKEKAKNLKAECLPDYYISTLETNHAPTIDEVWPHRYNGSVEFLETFISLNGGHGVFRKTDDKLVAWVCKCQLGTLSQLQTAEDFKKKGFASLITKSMSKEIALEGHNPLGMVGVHNVASQKMFEKLGFEILDGFYCYRFKLETIN